MPAQRRAHARVAHLIVCEVLSENAVDGPVDLLALVVEMAAQSHAVMARMRPDN